jgi:hypothetical protein
MERVASNLRGWLWLMGVVVGVLMLFIAPWAIRELRPLTSESVFQEAQAQLGMLRDTYSYADASGHLVRSWVHAGDVPSATAFVGRLPSGVKPLVQHYLTLALIDEGRLDDALREAQKLPDAPDYEIHDSPIRTRRDLFVRLTSELIDAQRYDDALRVVGWIEQVDSDHTHRFWYAHLAEHAADAGRLDVTEKALEQLRDGYFDLSTGEFLLVKAWLNQNQPRKALEWLRHRLPEPDRKPVRLRESLPAPMQANVDRAARLVGQGRVQAAAQIAEQTLRSYLLSHTQHNADFDLLARLSARFSETLPPATMRTLLPRLPVERYQCAESHLHAGYLYGLAQAGRWQELRRAVEQSDVSVSFPELKLWLGVAAHAQNRRDIAQQLGIDLAAQTVHPQGALPMIYFALEQGQTQVAREIANRTTTPALQVRIRRSLQDYLSAAPARSDEVQHAMQELALHEPWVLSLLAWEQKIQAVGQTPRSPLSVLKDIQETAMMNTLLKGDWRRYPAMLTLLREGVLPADEVDLTDRFLPRNMLWQDRYDPSLAEWLLSLPDVEEYDLVYGAAAAAQAGRFEDAERLIHAAGRAASSWFDIYRMGYAVGLAKQGEFRQAVREARRIRSDESRIGALARIAAEMRRQGL